MTARTPARQRPGAAQGAPLLDRILALDNLAAAWEAVAANAGMPGVDRMRISRFGRNWEERVIRLAGDVRGNRYRPSRLRIRFIPKKTPSPRRGGANFDHLARASPQTPSPRRGGLGRGYNAPSTGSGSAKREYRRIGIPTVIDRVLQRATLQVLMPRLDRKFLSCSYGYRPKRGVAQAVAAVIRYRDRGCRWIVEADIDDCFGSLDHRILMDLLGAEISDWRVLQLMRRWLDVGRPQAGVAKGIALGMPVSPLWANLYLHEMDWQLVRNRWPLVRYADDFVIPVRSRPAGEQALQIVGDVLADLKLELEPTKTRVTSFTDGFEFLGVRFQGAEYTFLWQQKRVTVRGKFDWLWGQHISYEY